VSTFTDSVKTALASTPPGNHLVLVADWRKCPLLPPLVAEGVVVMLRRNPPLIERNAMLQSPEQATSLLQLTRVVNEARDPQRRVFNDAGALQSWLGELLDDAEQARLHTFLAQRN
jgi:hypothetical protein